jgi:GPH family glycoside/pentoside/hexuronide:cation symporter
MIQLIQKAQGEARSVSYASGNFGKALVFGSADLTILYLLTDVLDIPGTQAAALMLTAVLGDLVFDMLAIVPRGMV